MVVPTILLPNNLGFLDASSAQAEATTAAAAASRYRPCGPLYPLFLKELTYSVNSVEALRGAAVKPFGSFVSILYAKSGDLDVSVDLWSGSDLPISKKNKQNVLRELMRALQIRGVARSVHFIPNARVPVLQYMSNNIGISCDISINNYPGQIKSRILYWINTMDDRFGDIVLLVKEWAKAQNINDPKNGTLNSYSLCLLVLFHFQTCEPAILPPLKEIYDGNVAGMLYCDDKHVDEVISTYTGRFERVQNNRNWMAKSYCLFVSLSSMVTWFQWFVDLVKNFRHDIYTVSSLLLFRLKIRSRDLIMLLGQLVRSSCINSAYNHVSWIEPAVVVPYQYHDDLRLYAGRRSQAGQYQNQPRRREYSPYQSAATSRYEPVGRRFHNGPTWDYGS
ncbi:hypothetical protein EJB05_43679, partial [Eragrostis curvula]